MRVTKTKIELKRKSLSFPLPPPPPFFWYVFLVYSLFNIVLKHYLPKEKIIICLATVFQTEKHRKLVTQMLLTSPSLIRNQHPVKVISLIIFHSLWSHKTLLPLSSLTLHSHLQGAILILIKSVALSFTEIGISLLTFLLKGVSNKNTLNLSTASDPLILFSFKHKY